MPPLGEVLRAALGGSSERTLRDLAERETAGSRQTRAAGVLPSVRVTGSFRGEERIDISRAGIDDRLIFGFTVSQPLYHWGALRADKEIGILQYQSEGLLTQDAMLALARQTRAQFLAAIVEKQEVTSARRRLAIRRDRLELQRQRREDGLVSAAEYGTLALQVEQLEIEALREEGAFEERLRGLSRLTGLSRERLEDLLPEKVPEVEPLELEAIGALGGATDEAVDANPALRRLEKQISVERRNLRIDRKRNWPKVDFTAGFTQNERDINDRRTEEQFFFAGLSVNWNIFDGFATAGRVKSATARLERASARSNLLHQRLEENLRSARRDLELAARSLSLQERLLSADRGAYEKTREDFENEDVSQLDMEAAELRMLEGEIRSQRARVDYYKALAELVALLGRDPFVEPAVSNDLSR